ncbi:exodeoxyribonuclease VII large subunit [Cyanobium sp. WAJ14-Wanaka]|uniref:exodeoxyribonuclease VII large subunit n=1 Tax=Cyanobium sp. WAJ14-Wanaka TaxID=2823725 RepID=UPI0020CF8083|nr:exodeoxyribonuclease VII large subunit [Cyanobium sp. WAJ14-Wanaka]MCP9776196.1 exodeoxyribonuclease VII large subunit [Cyanobium sp. WAJ14-Wanaka]
MRSGASSAIPHYSVSELNGAVATLLERGFAPRFLLDATAIKPQLKKGHLWLTLSDGQASISAVVWASQLGKLSFMPNDGDGIVVVGKLNFWANRASLCVQVLEIRASLGGVLRQFERVKELLDGEGMLDPGQKRPLPALPNRIALLTSVPSSALADMLRTAKERWPATSVLVVPIPVQGQVEATICRAIEQVGGRARALGIEALVLARGGGSREDLAVFDGEALARCLLACPIPVVCGLGHEDDTTVADLVADYRAATPTAALVAVLPDRATALAGIQQLRQYLLQILALQLNGAISSLKQLQQRLSNLHPLDLLKQHRLKLSHQRQLLRALSPQHLLARGFSLVRDQQGRLVRSVSQLELGDRLQIQLDDGGVDAEVRQIQ